MKRFIIGLSLLILFNINYLQVFCQDKPENRVSLGYTIPVIDISSQKERQVFVDREKCQYFGHPTTVLLKDNHTLIIVYPKGHGRGEEKALLLNVGMPTIFKINFQNLGFFSFFLAI